MVSKHEGKVKPKRCFGKQAKNLQSYDFKLPLRTWDTHRSLFRLRTDKTIKYGGK